MARMNWRGALALAATLLLASPLAEAEVYRDAAGTLVPAAAVTAPVVIGSVPIPSVGPSSASYGLPGDPQVYWALTIENTGGGAGYVALGAAGASANSIYIGAGSSKCINTQGQRSLSAYSPTSTAIQVTQANGCISNGNPGISGVGTLPTSDAAAQALLATNNCTQPCPVAQLGDQSVYLAWGGTTNAALTNTAGAVSIQTTALNLMSVDCANPNTSKVYLQFFDSAASITLGTTAPTMIVECPPGNGTSDGLGDYKYTGLKFVAGLRIDATTTPTGATAPTSAVSASIAYKLGN